MKNTTSWQSSSTWYSKEVGLTGHYYHQNVVIPGVLRLLDLKPSSSVLDLACGQGVLSRHLKDYGYQGIDLARSLIDYANHHKISPTHRFTVGDITKTLPINKKDFTHATIILALQNVEELDKVIANAARHLSPKGTLVLVLNHPCFRIPRQSSWEIDEGSKLQYRRINRYLSPLKIPLKTNPGLGESSPLTWSFHLPLSIYFKELSLAGFAVTALEEWISDKDSEGKAAKMENLARSEFPLFLAIKACLSITKPL